MTLTYLELFAGVGGMSLGFDRAGFRCVGHCEIEPFPRRILKHRWPDVPLFGDVCDLRGDQVESPTIVTFGAPCQDLSVAGKRAGLDGSRSSLFYQGIRLWEETNAPYALYENVLGALSSNKGRDFARVLSAFVGSTVDVPADGWRGGGGVVAGRTGVAAWRVLDAQYFGVPQRRRRVFVLGARAGGVDPAEVLSLAESLSGHTPQGREAGEGAAEDARGRAKGGIAIPLLEVTSRQGKSGEGSAGIGNPGDPMFTLQRTQQNGVLAYAQNASGGGIATFQNTGQGWWNARSGQQTLRDGCSGSGPKEANVVVAFDNRPQVNISGVQYTLTTEGFVNPPSVVAYDARGNGDGNVVSTLPGDHLNRITDYTPVVMTVDKQSGQPEEGSVAPTLRTDLAHDMGPVVTFAMRRSDDYTEATVASTVASRDYKSATDLVVAPPVTAGAHPGSYNGMDAIPVAAAILEAEVAGTMNGLKARSLQTAQDGYIRSIGGGRPRRLTPLECERLMGWPDRWTDVPDEKGKPASDSSRYKACGNGVATPVAHWIALRLRQAIEGVQ